MQYQKAFVTVAVSFSFMTAAPAPAQTQDSKPKLSCELRYLAELPEPDPDLSPKKGYVSLPLTQSETELNFYGNTRISLVGHPQYFYSVELRSGISASMELVDIKAGISTRFKSSSDLPADLSKIDLILPAQGEFQGQPIYEVSLHCRKISK